ncbi:hypothetical protein UlMin_009343 [Ulmus minor]
MASAGDNFPRQSHYSQPGEEHIMNPVPQFMNPNYKPANKLHGKVALVTGGDSGIGKAVCYLFAIEGATVAFTYIEGVEERDKDVALKMLREAKRSDAADPIAIPADIGFDENCKRVIDVVVQEYGRLDILVNNAAVLIQTNSVEEITEPQLLRVFRTNIFSQFFLVRHALKHMREGSCIINSASMNAYVGSPKVVDYCATKGAIVAFTRSLALQLADKGIRVNGVAPGRVWTPMPFLAGNTIESVGSGTPMGRAGQPHELAPCYLFLASNESSYYTGQVLHANGGTIVNG